jgi:hypothetical protein
LRTIFLAAALAVAAQPAMAAAKVDVAAYV